MEEALLFLVVGGVLALSVVAAFAASRLGVPSLVAFLAFGMLLGSEGIGGFEFANPELARIIGSVCLVAILFEGGMSTSLRRLREAFVPAALLSTVCVVITALLTGLAAHYLFGLPWLYAMLLGAVVSSTDAAAVFATLRFTKIRRRVARLIEAESGGNDPMAIALTVGFIGWIQQPEYNIGNLFLLLSQQLGIGLVAGLTLGAAAMYIFGRLPHSIGAFAPVASVAMAALTFGLTSVIGGSGFLAVYIVGLAIGSTPSRYRGQLTMFHEGVAFVSQVTMFVILGLLVFPHQLWEVAFPSIALAVLLVFLIRPIAVWLSIPFSHFTRNEKALIGWAGLRGAVPIVLAAFVLSSGIEHSNEIFNAVFFVVLVSALMQGTTLDWVAQKLGVVDKLPDGKEVPHPDRMEKIYFHVAPEHAIVGVHVYEIGLIRQARVTSIKRRGKPIEVEKDTIIKSGDRLCIEAPYSLHPEVEDVFMRWRRRV